MNRFALLRRRVRRTILARRRLLAAVCAAVAVAAGLQSAAGPPAATTPVLTASRDIPGGAVVHAADLATAAFAPDSVPSGVLTSSALAVGRTTSTPVREGEPLTDVRLVAGSILEGYPGAVAAPVRIGDPGAVGLLRIGDRVDVIAADPQGGDAVVVASNAAVIAIPEQADTNASMVSGGLIVLAIPDGTARSIAAAGVSSFLSVVINR